MHLMNILFIMLVAEGPSLSPAFTRGNSNFKTYVSNNYYDPNQVSFHQ